MIRPPSLAASTSLAALLAVASAGLLHAQGVVEPARPQADAAAPPSTDATAQPGAITATPPAAAAPVVEVDPLVAQIRQAAASARGAIAADRAAVVDFYSDAKSAIWVTAEGFTPRARHAMAEIAKADDWGLEARAFELPQMAPGETSLAALADAEIKMSLAALKYARHARGGRLDPLQVSRNFDQKPTLRDPKVVMDDLAASQTPGDYLRGLHPKHVQFERLRQALLKARGAGSSRPEEKAETVVRIPDGPTLKVGVKHPNVALLRQRLKVPSRQGEADVFDGDLQAAVRAFQEKNSIQPTGTVTSRTRSALNGADAPRPAFGSDVQRILVNMERWRWMPEDLGAFYVWDNVPEFQSRVVKNGQLVWQTRIVVGKPETQTALFSANMRYIVFGPEWGVPDSIKIKEILPYLRPTSDGGGFFNFGGTTTDTRVLQKHNLRVSYNGKPVDASQVDWQQVDIRRYTFIQPSGAGNVLGGIKFRFPNKHDIYMHDTPSRDLFEKTTRAYSHGCIRVQNPGRLAEILLEEDKGWSAAHVRNLLAQGNNNEVTLTKQIPVHITYFTAMVGEDGKLQSFGDLYGHDNRVLQALAGRPMPLEAPPIASSFKDIKEAKRTKPSKQSNNDLFSGLFGN